ncbi:MAG: hypothetical protein DMG85_19095 [Acidobacteria bacterium]|nr:MAG: hypothetical protein DMG85_19095 [Acidobacteriota bacterium]
MDLHGEAMVATGNFEQLRILTRDAGSAETCAALMGAIGLGSKPNYPWDQYPSRARTNIFQILLTLSGHLADPTVHEA